MSNRIPIHVLSAKKGFKVLNVVSCKLFLDMQQNANFHNWFTIETVANVVTWIGTTDRMWSVGK